jgi:hypothetical protein
MNCHEGFLPPISSDARQRIEAGLLEIEASWHNYPHQDEGGFQAAKRYLSLAYDVFAQEIFSEMDCTDELLEDTLVKLAYDAVIEHGWVHWVVGTLVPSQSCTEHLFAYWVPAGSLKRAKAHLLSGRIAAWRAKEIHRILSPRQTISERLEEFRNREWPNLSHDALAEEIGLERSRYYNLKAGKPVRADAYAKVAAFTKIPVSDLMPAARLRTPRRRIPTESDGTSTAESTRPGYLEHSDKIS